MLERRVKAIDKNIVTKKLLGAFILFNKVLWEKLPESMLNLNAVQDYGRFLHAIVRARSSRNQNNWTYFNRNRPEMDLIYDLATEKLGKDNAITIMVLACSVGLEAYSIKYRLRELQPDFEIYIKGIELDDSALAVAKSGSYPLAVFEQHFERLSKKEFNDIFTVKNNVAYIKPELKQGIDWYQGDAFSQNIPNLYGKQDLVLANRVLCHMYPDEAERCLEEITNLVADNGYLFISGVDLPVREKVMAAGCFSAIRDRLEAIHYGDRTLLRGWPWYYWGLEPIKREAVINLGKYAMVYKNCSSVRA